jgi:hypothetical protein
VEIAGVNAQATTRERLLAKLGGALREALEINRTDAVPLGDSFEDDISFETASKRSSAAIDVAMKRHDLLAHLLNEGCVLLRESSNQSWWVNPASKQRCAVPHLTDFAFLGIDSQLVRKICRDLQIQELVDTIVSPFR